MISWDDFEETTEKPAVKQKSNPALEADDFELTSEAAAVPKACSIDDEGCEACQ